MNLRLLHVLSYITIGLTLGFFAICSFWLVYPYKVASISEPIKIMNKNRQIAIGDIIIQELKVDKPNNEPPQSASRLLLCNDGNLVTLALVTKQNLPIGKYTIINNNYTLPPKVAVGSKCTFVWRQEYRVNPIRVINVEWTSEEFTIVKE